MADNNHPIPIDEDERQQKRSRGLEETNHGGQSSGVAETLVENVIAAHETIPMETENVVNDNGEIAEKLKQVLDQLVKMKSENGLSLGLINRRLDGIDGRLDGIDREVKENGLMINGRLDGIDGRLDGIDGRLDRIDGRLDLIDSSLILMNDVVSEQSTELKEMKNELQGISANILVLGSRFYNTTIIPSNFSKVIPYRQLVKSIPGHPSVYPPTGLTYLLKQHLPLVLNSCYPVRSQPPDGILPKSQQELDEMRSFDHERLKKHLLAIYWFYFDPRIYLDGGASLAETSHCLDNLEHFFKCP